MNISKPTETSYKHDFSPINFSEAKRLAASRCNTGESIHRTHLKIMKLFLSRDLQQFLFTVQTAVSNMEKTNKSEFTSSVKRSQNQKPNQMRSCEPVLRQGRISRNSRNRRSMSDPNLQFLEIIKQFEMKSSEGNLQNFY